MGTLKETLSQTIKRVRESKRTHLGKEPTQAEIAELAGIPTRTYQNIERGISWPEEENIAAIAKALGVDPPEALFTPPAPAPTPAEALAVLQKTIENLQEVRTAQEPHPDVFDVLRGLPEDDPTWGTIEDVLRARGMVLGAKKPVK